MANGPLNASGGIRIVVSFAVWCTQVEKQLPFWFWLTHHQHEYIDNRPLILMAVETAGLEVSALHLFVYTHSRTHTNEWKSLATHFALFLVVCLASADTNTHTRHPSTNWTARKTHQHQCASEPIALARRIYSVHRLFCCVCFARAVPASPVYGSLSICIRRIFLLLIRFLSVSLFFALGEYTARVKFGAVNFFSCVVDFSLCSAIHCEWNAEFRHTFSVKLLLEIKYIKKIKSKNRKKKSKSTSKLLIESNVDDDDKGEFTIYDPTI